MPYRYGVASHQHERDACDCAEHHAQPVLVHEPADPGDEQSQQGIGKPGVADVAVQAEGQQPQSGQQYRYAELLCKVLVRLGMQDELGGDQQKSRHEIARCAVNERLSEQQPDGQHQRHGGQPGTQRSEQNDGPGT